MGHADEFNNFAQALLLVPGEYTVKIGDHEEKVLLKGHEETVVKQ